MQKKAIFDKQISWEVWILFLTALCLCLSPLLSVFVTNTDDVFYFLSGATHDFGMPYHMAVGTGRFFLVFSGYLYMLPYLFDSFFFFKVVTLLPVLLMPLACMWALCSLGVEKRATVLLGFFYIAFMQQYTGYYPLSSFYLVFTVPLLLFCASTVLWIRYLDQKAGLVSYVGSLLLFFFSILPYETLFLTFTTLHLAIGVAYKNEGLWKARYRQALLRLRGHGLFVLVYIASFFLFMGKLDPNLHPDHHLVSLSVPKIIQTWAAFTQSALPLAMTRSDTVLYLVGTFWSENTLYAGLRSLWSMTTISSYLLFLFVSRGSFLVLSNIQIKPTIARMTLFVGTVIILFAPLLHSFTLKYQSWVESGARVYVPTFFTFLGLCFVSFSVLGWAVGLIKSEKLRFRFLVCVSVVLGFMSFVHYCLNGYQAKYGEMQADLYRLALPVLQKDVLPSLKQDEALLFANIPSVPTYDFTKRKYVDFWETLLSYRLQRHINVFYKKEKKVNLCSELNCSSLYYVRFEHPVSSGDASVVIGKLKRSSTGMLLSDKVSIYSYARLRDYAVSWRGIEMAKLPNKRLASGAVEVEALPAVSGKMVGVIESQNIPIESVTMSRFLGYQKFF